MLEIFQAIRKNINITRLLSSLIYKTFDINVVIVEFYPNAFENNTNSFNNSIYNNYIDIDFKFWLNKFYLKIYKIAISYLSKLKNINFTKKMIKLNKKIEAYNFQNNKPKMNILISLKAGTEILILYKKT